jgi:hypothetical protein
MGEIDLARAIRERLLQVLAELRMPSDRPNLPPRAPTVVNGFLPPKRSKSDSDFPFVVVRPSSGTTGNDGLTRVRVKLIIGCYSEDFDGHEYGLIVLERLRIGFMELPTLENRYRMEMPMEWELYDDQPYPEWMLEVRTEWSIATPLEIPDSGVVGYDTQDPYL